MANTAIRNYVRVPKEEYKRLKKLQKYFESFLVYIEHKKNIKKARNDVKSGKIVSQEKLFKELGV